MITAAPDTTFASIVEGFVTGLTGTIGVRIRDASGSDAIARTTTGITESTDPDFPSIVTYTKTLTAPTPVGNYTIVWDDGTNTADEDLLVSGLSPAATNAYISVASLKATLGLDNTSYATNDLNAAINAACRGIDQATGRRFYPDVDNTSVRKYTPQSNRIVMIDDIVDCQAVAIDRTGNGTFSEAWTVGTDYVLQPANAITDGMPYEWIKTRRYSRRWFPWGLEDSVRVTGQFGWETVPDVVVQATTILAGKLLRRSREAPFGIITVGVDASSAMRIARTDPDVAVLIADLIRHTPFI